MDSYQLTPLGDQALVITLGDSIDPVVNRRLQTLIKEILQANLPGIVALIPAYSTLTVTYDGIVTNYDKLSHTLKPLIDSSLSAPLATPTTWLIPVRYGGDGGPDLADVANFADQSTGEVVQAHTDQDYLIYFLGFLPGFAYMGSVDDKIAMPRLAKPRLEIPAGSVGIAGKQTGFYPVASPGGWRIIGQTPLNLYDPAHPQSFYSAGDRVRFFAVTDHEFDLIKTDVANGTYQVKAVN